MALAGNQSRYNRAREALNNEGDSMLRRSEKALAAEDGMPKDKKEKIKAVLICLAMIFIPATFYFVLVMCWFLVWHSSMVWMFIPLVLELLAIITLCIYALFKHQRSFFWCGVLCLEAVIVGSILGFFAYYSELCFFYKYKELRAYTNVGASQTVQQFSDAGQFLFTEDTRLDPARGVGMASKWFGGTFCVAPIVDSTMGSADGINYWAVGQDCCTSRGTFFCDSARDSSSKTALVMLKPDQVARPWMTWAVATDYFPTYDNAIKLETANYLTQAASPKMLVVWTNDPPSFIDGYYNAAVVKCLIVSAIFGVLLSIQAYVVSFMFLASARGPKLGMPLRPGKSMAVP